MSADALYFCSLFAAGLPFLAIIVILCNYLLRRAVWHHKSRRGEKKLGFCSCVTALGMAMLFLQVFIRPTLQHVIEVKQEEDKDEDDEGDPESGGKGLHRQLKRVRRGEEVGDLTFRR